MRSPSPGIQSLDLTIYRSKKTNQCKLGLALGEGVTSCKFGQFDTAQDVCALTDHSKHEGRRDQFPGSLKWQETRVLPEKNFPLPVGFLPCSAKAGKIHFTWDSNTSLPYLWVRREKREFADLSLWREARKIESSLQKSHDRERWKFNPNLKYAVVLRTESASSPSGQVIIKEKRREAHSPFLCRKDIWEQTEDHLNRQGTEAHCPIK